ncbi:hypothetical protein R0J93_27855, partial [Pseudoalteromonas sp. SIMBA_148]
IQITASGNHIPQADIEGLTPEGEGDSKPCSGFLLDDMQVIIPYITEFHRSNRKTLIRTVSDKGKRTVFAWSDKQT